MNNSVDLRKIHILEFGTFDKETVRKVITGYTSTQRYTIIKKGDEECYNIQLKLETLLSSHTNNFYDISEEVWVHYAAIAQNGFCLRAVVGSQLVGICLAEPMKWNNSLMIWEFHVAEPFRKKGVGRLMMEKIILRASDAGFRIITLETQNTNVPAIRFYKACGFELEGIDLSYYSNEDWPDGEVALFMKRRLVPKS